MNFIKDILLIDFETTDVDPTKAKPIQLAAVLLDKKTLEEKTTFSSFIKQDLKNANPQALKVNGITKQQLAQAPSQDEVIHEFVKKFGTDVMLASWVQYIDRAMLFLMLKDADLDPHIYDYYHFLDVWPIAYTHLTKQGNQVEFRSSDAMFKYFGIPPRGTHDALEDCRIAAEIFKKIFNSQI
jgi:DNA polymerase III epsilon subunit-like protein